MTKNSTRSSRSNTGTCPDVCKIDPVSKSFNPFKTFKKKKYQCNCVVKDDEMPTDLVHDDQAEDFNVVNECFDETTGQPKSFLLRHYCKMPRTSVAIFPLDPYVVFGVRARSARISIISLTSNGTSLSEVLEKQLT